MMNKRLTTIKMWHPTLKWRTEQHHGPSFINYSLCWFFVFFIFHSSYCVHSVYFCFIRSFLFYFICIFFFFRKFNSSIWASFNKKGFILFFKREKKKKCAQNFIFNQLESALSLIFIQDILWIWINDYELNLLKWVSSKF